MYPSFSGCAFQLTIPKVKTTGDEMSVSYMFNNKDNQTEHIVFYRAAYTDINQRTFHSEDGQQVFPVGKMYLPAGCHIEITHNTSNYGTLTMEFLSDSGEKTTVAYGLSMDMPARLQDVRKSEMTDGEKEKYASVLVKKPLEAAKPVKPAAVPAGIAPAGGVAAGHITAGAASILPLNTELKELPELNRYIKAVHKEMRFLQEGGGKTYKVSNGSMILKENHIYWYAFELEAELYIADNAPVTLAVGTVTASGYVLMCEDFQIIIQLETSIGDSIPRAQISVAPWKLLEALNSRIFYAETSHSYGMAKTLMREGPALATAKSVEQIPKGQEQVIAHAISQPVTVIWGPPGTGKTHTMGELAIRFLNQGYSVLIVAHSNVSVDGAIGKISELLEEKKQMETLRQGKVLRYGYIRDEKLNKNPYVNAFCFALTKNPALKQKYDGFQTSYENIVKTKGLKDPAIVDLKKELAKISKDIHEQELACVAQARIVATTISKLVIEKIFQDRKFDVVMFDEVSMAYVPQVAAAATFAARHMICVGDFMQLSPIAQSEAKKELGEDIFSCLGINRDGKPYFHPWLVMLDEQRRMEPSIAAFSNRYVYRGLLKNHPSVFTSRKDIVAAEMFSGHAINLLDLTSSCCAADKNADNSRYNILSAIISFCTAVHTEQSENIKTVSVITPYAAQTRLVRALTLDYREKVKKVKTEVRCATVHQFQGSESDVIVFDAVESYPLKKPGWLMDKDLNSVMRLINVAVTRAKGKLITVANATFWNNHLKKTEHTLSQLLSYLRAKGNVIEYQNGHELQKVILSLSLEHGPMFYAPGQYMEQLEKDIQKAHEEIFISLPSGKLDPGNEEKISSLLKSMENIRIIVKCNDIASLPPEWKMIAKQTENATFPLIMIDGKITWYGIPTAPWVFKDGSTGYQTVCQVVCRIQGKHTAEIIRSLTDLEFTVVNGVRRSLLSDGKNFSATAATGGLASYVAEHKKCKECGKPLALTKSKAGKTYLRCTACSHHELLSPDDVNHYMCASYVRCPKHKCEMKAKVGKWGLYIHCPDGHNLKPEEI